MCSVHCCKITTRAESIAKPSESLAADMHAMDLLSYVNDYFADCPVGNALFWLSNSLMHKARVPSCSSMVYTAQVLDNMNHGAIVKSTCSA